MEPLSAFGAAAGVLQFVDFTGRLLTESYEIFSSNTGSTDRNEDLLKITQNLLALNKRLAKPTEEPRQRTTTNPKDGLDAIQPSTDDIIGAQLESLITSCNHVGKDLVAVLDKLQLQPESKSRKWRSFRQALLSIWSQSEIEVLQRRIDSFRQQISLALLVSLRENLALKESKATDDDIDIVTRIDNPEESFLAQHSEVKNTKQATEHPFVGRNLLNNLESKENWQSAIIELIHESYINNGSTLQDPPKGLFGAKDAPLAIALLESLGFSRMNSRVGRIVKQHGSTFEWLFSEQGLTEKRWAHFPSWLKSEQSIYWITGKPGAGKSTLMKFIHSDDRTKTYLRDWAKGSKTTLASFFFWNSGNTMQKSQEGLLRTLLYETLAQRPELVPVVLPHRWESYSLFGIDKPTWSWSELVKAFGLLISATTADNLMFMIDGLDEFDGDHTELIEFISGLSSVPHVKLCVASRPWPVFEDAFNSRPSLMLQCLTYHDIRKYVSEKFTLNPGFANLERLDGGYAKDLIENVVEKASDVFLWVVLVVRSLLEGLTIGDRLSDLQKRLDAIPAELENLFWNMMTSLKDIDFERACELFQLVVAHDCPTLLELGYADEEADMMYRRRIKFASDTEKEARAAIMRRRLSHLSRGLLEAHVPPDTSLANAEVVYLHRTVKDFFDQDEVWAKVLAATDDSFNVQGSWCRSSISVLKTMDTAHLALSHFWTQVTTCIKMTISLLEECRQVHKDCNNCRIQHVKLLDEIDRTADVLASTRNRQGRSLKIVFAPGSNPCWTTTRYNLYSCPTFLNFAVSCQLHEYVEAKLKESRSLVSGPVVPVLYNAISSFKVLQELDNSTISHGTPSLPLIKLLFEYGADPEAHVFGETIWERVLGYVLGGFPQISIAPVDLLDHIDATDSGELPFQRPDTPDPDSEDFFETTRDNQPYIKDIMGGNRTTLQYILEEGAEDDVSFRRSSISTAGTRDRTGRIRSKEPLSHVQLDLWSEILKMFLSNGADVELCRSTLSGHAEFKEVIQLCESGEDDRTGERKSGKARPKLGTNPGKAARTPRTNAASHLPSKTTKQSKVQLESLHTGSDCVSGHTSGKSRVDDHTYLQGTGEQGKQSLGRAKIWKRLGAFFTKRKSENR